MRMPAILSRLFGARDETAHELYGALVAQARRPAFYADLGVPDTPAGRYDMIVLHAFLLFERLGGGAEERALGQRVFDIMFVDLDRSLREMGIGDLSVPKRIKVMARAFYGHVAAYGEACKAGSTEMMREAIARNIYPDRAGQPEGAAALAAYAFAARARLAAQPFAEIKAGRLAFPQPSNVEAAS